jgi:hypothetical protein
MAQLQSDIESGKSDIEYRIKCFAFEVQDPLKHPEFSPGKSWWLLNRTKKAPKGCLTFAEQIGVDVKRIPDLYGRQWASIILSLFAPFLRTRDFSKATWITVNMSNEYADYGDESTCPHPSTVVPIEQQDSRNPLPWKKLCRDVNIAGQLLVREKMRRMERKEAEMVQAEEQKRKKVDLARMEAEAEAVLTRLAEQMRMEAEHTQLAEQMRMEAEHDDKSVASLTQQMGALSPTRNKKVDIDALTDLMGGLSSPNKINQVTATGTTPPDVDGCRLSPQKGADTTTEHSGAHHAQTPATSGCQ